MLRGVLIFILILFAPFMCYAQVLTHSKEIGLYQLDKRTQFIYDKDMLSPKSAHWIKPDTVAINALERGATIIYNTNTWQKEKIISHTFEHPEFINLSHYSGKLSTRGFMGKPVEMTSNADYTWIPYYRFSWDNASRENSGIAQVSNKSLEVVKLLPAGNIPKMITLSHQQKLLASTNWGDNTIGLYQMENNTPVSYKEVVVEHKLNGASLSGDRDKNCGYCLRGTVFTQDDKYLIVGRMGGGGLAIIDAVNGQYLGTTRAVPLTPRHLVTSKDGQTLYISTSFSGQVARLSVQKLIDNWKTLKLSDWQILSLGAGVRTIALSQDEKYLYAAMNGSSQIAVIDMQQWKVVQKIKVASFPVGLAVSPDDRYILATSQGKSGQGGGNHLDVYERKF